MPDRVRDYGGMTNTEAAKSHSVLATNLRALMAQHEFYTSDEKVAKKAGVDQKTVWRMIKEKNSPSLEKIEAVAAVFGLLPWQILVPGLDPTNPPVVHMTRTESALYTRLKSDMAKLVGGTP